MRTPTWWNSWLYWPWNFSIFCFFLLVFAPKAHPCRFLCIYARDSGDTLFYLLFCIAILQALCISMLQPHQKTKDRKVPPYRTTVLCAIALYSVISFQCTLTKNIKNHATLYDTKWHYMTICWYGTAVRYHGTLGRYGAVQWGYSGAVLRCFTSRYGAGLFPLATSTSWQTYWKLEPCRVSPQFGNIPRESRESLCFQQMDWVV